MDKQKIKDLKSECYDLLVFITQMQREISIRQQIIQKKENQIADLQNEKKKDLLQPKEQKNSDRRQKKK